MSETQTMPPAKPADESVIVTDARGRSITIKPVTSLEQFRLMKFLGGTNNTYMGMAIMAASVRKIDDVPTPTASNDIGVEWIISKLGDEGWNAVQAHYASLAPDAEADAEKVMDEAKN